jgi:glycosyltransferase involved in cell wall biosynthesis
MLLARLVYPRMDGLVFPSRGAADSLRTITRLRADKIAVIPSYLDFCKLDERAAQPLPPWAAAIYALPTLVCVGRLVSSKGIDVLLRAHARLRRSSIDHHLLVLGDGPMRDRLAELTRSLGVRDTVFMAGFMANPYPFIKAAAALALPSRFEGLSLVLLEALWLGVPIVAAASPGGVGEVLADGRCGLLVPRDNDEALADSIARLLSDAALRARLSAAGPMRAREFSAERVLPDWERLLNRV